MVDNPIKRELLSLAYLAELGRKPGDRVDRPAKRYRAQTIDRIAAEDLVPERGRRMQMVLEQNDAWWKTGASQLDFPNLYERALLTAGWLFTRICDTPEAQKLSLMHAGAQIWHELGRQHLLIQPPLDEKDDDWVLDFMNQYRPTRAIYVDLCLVAMVESTVFLSTMVEHWRTEPVAIKRMMQRFNDIEKANQYVRDWQIAIAHFIADCLMTAARIGENPERARTVLRPHPIIQDSARRSGRTLRLDEYTEPPPIFTQ